MINQQRRLDIEKIRGHILQMPATFTARSLIASALGNTNPSSGLMALTTIALYDFERKKMITRCGTGQNRAIIWRKTNSEAREMLVILRVVTDKSFADLMGEATKIGLTGQFGQLAGVAVRDGRELS